MEYKSTFLIYRKDLEKFQNMLDSKTDIEKYYVEEVCNVRFINGFTGLAEIFSNAKGYFLRVVVKDLYGNELGEDVGQRMLGQFVFVDKNTNNIYKFTLGVDDVPVCHPVNTFVYKGEVFKLQYVDKNQYPEMVSQGTIRLQALKCLQQSLKEIKEEHKEILDEISFEYNIDDNIQAIQRMIEDELHNSKKEDRYSSIFFCKEEVAQRIREHLQRPFMSAERVNIHYENCCSIWNSLQELTDYLSEDEPITQEQVESMSSVYKLSDGHYLLLA